MSKKKAYEIIQTLCKNGFEAYISGGAARDILLDEDPSDIDIATNAKPDEIIPLFKDNHKVNTVGVSFKVVLVDSIEVGTYRTDQYFGLSDKNCMIKVAKTIEEDLARRDLTINSMAFCNITGDIVDPYGGKQDLKDKIIRFTGSAYERIYEDPCRILRACRFLAKIKGKFAIETYKALKKHAHLVKEKVAPERINKELMKVLVYEKPSIFFQALYDIGVLKDIISELSNCYGHDHGKFHTENVWEHSMLVGDAISPRRPLLRLTGYLHDIGKPVTFNGESFLEHEKFGADMIEIVLQRLKFSIKEVSFAKALVKHHMRTAGRLIKPKGVRRMLKKFTDDNVNWKNWLQLKIADCKGNLGKDDYSPEHIGRIVNLIHGELKPSQSNAFSIKDLNIDGTIIMEFLNVPQGPVVGKILNQLIDAVLDNPELNDYDRLTEMARLLHEG